MRAARWAQPGSGLPSSPLRVGRGRQGEVLGAEPPAGPALPSSRPGPSRLFSAGGRGGGSGAAGGGGAAVALGVPVLVAVYVGYLGMGAAGLQALERPAEVRAAQHLLREHWNLLANHSCLPEPVRRRLMEGIIQAYKSGITLQGNTTNLGRWDFSGSFFFSISTVTTIGYGNLSPSTAAGRIFCIVFALFGIPLNLVLLNEIGQLMLLGVQHCARRLEENKASFLMKTCALVTGLLLFLLLPPLLFSDKEGWAYDDGFYYSFITLSTIGFGDYMVGMNPDRTYPNWYKNVISLWILFGMAWLALVIKFCINILESSSDFCQCNKKNMKTAEDLMDGNKNSVTGLQNEEICSNRHKNERTS